MKMQREMIVGVALVLALVATGCATGAVPPPTQPAETASSPPESLASKPEDVAGVWRVTLPDNSGKADLDLTREGGYGLVGVEGFVKGATIDTGRSWFEGTQLKIQSTGGGCLDFQQKLIPNCIGIYQAYVTRQGDKPITLRLAAIDDPGVDRKEAYDGKVFVPAQP